MGHPVDTREAALAAVIRSLLPDGPYSLCYAGVYARFYIRVMAQKHTDDRAQAHGRAHYAYSRAYQFPLLATGQQAQIDAAYMLIYG